MATRDHLTDGLAQVQTRLVQVDEELRDLLVGLAPVFEPVEWPFQQLVNLGLGQRCVEHPLHEKHRRVTEAEPESNRLVRSQGDTGEVERARSALDLSDELAADPMAATLGNDANHAQRDRVVRMSEREGGSHPFASLLCDQHQAGVLLEPAIQIAETSRVSRVDLRSEEASEEVEDFDEFFAIANLSQLCH